MSDLLHHSHEILARMAERYDLVRELDALGEVRRWEAFDITLQRPVLLEFLPHELADNPSAVERFWQSARASARRNTSVGQRVLDAGTDPETGRAFVVREWSALVAEDSTVALPVRLGTQQEHVRQAFLPRGLKLPVLGLVVAATLAMLIVRPGLRGWLAWIDEPLGQATHQFVLGPAPTALAAPTVVATAVPKAAAGPTGVPTPSATRTATPAAGVARRIVNTDGRGVALRGSPGGDRLPGKGYDEGATVQAFESSGEWTRIQGADGRQGWVLSVTLSR